MPPRKRGAAGGASKKAKQPRPDWRVPIFYWRGTVTDKEWRGAWVASADGLPSDTELAESKSTFELTCTSELVTGASASFTGSYKLDNGDGLADFSDVEHNIRIADGASAIVAARGTTEFGEFVSLGKLQDGTLTLARRYIADNDPRCKMNAQQVLARLQSGGEDEAHSAAPWTALPWKVPSEWPAALPPPGEEPSADA